MIRMDAQGIQFHPVRNEPLITETRIRTSPHFALPRAIAKTAETVEAEGRWRVRTFQDGPTSALVILCCKCGRPLNGPIDPTKPQGQWSILNHYAESVFHAVGADNHIQPFTILHCADCAIQPEHGGIALGIHAGSHQHFREHQASKGRAQVSPNMWAMHWAHWSGLEPDTLHHTHLLADVLRAGEAAVARLSVVPFDPLIG